MSNSYLYQEKPFILHGITSLSASSGYTTISFNTDGSTAFSSVPTVVCTPSGAGTQDYEMVSLKVRNINLQTFQVLGWLKDGRKNESVGGYQYNGDIYWIAII
jgi:hypothetical protein